MKGIYMSSVVLIFVCMVLFPLLSMDKTVMPGTPDSSQSQSGGSDNKETLRILMTDKNKIETITAREYVIGVVSAEMPAEYEPEALKAQAVVAYTYMKYKAELRKDEDYDVTDSHETDQEFLSSAEAKERFGDSYDTYTDKISAAVDEVLGQTVTYDGKPILASCHSISGGKTESAANMWGGDYPYLQPVESVGDVLSPNYLSEASVSSDEMKSALKSLDITAEGDASEWLGKITRSDSGTVLKINVCGTEIKGSQLRTALGLRSANFDVEYSDGVFNFTVRGYGHGVGLSQYGAQFMALQGSTYKEILNWYYTDCEITQGR